MGRDKQDVRRGGGVNRKLVEGEGQIECWWKGRGKQAVNRGRGKQVVSRGGGVNRMLVQEEGQTGS